MAKIWFWKWCSCLVLNSWKVLLMYFSFWALLWFALAPIGHRYRLQFRLINSNWQGLGVTSYWLALVSIAISAFGCSLSFPCDLQHETFSCSGKGNRSCGGLLNPCFLSDGMRVGQTFLILTIFIKNTCNIYISK
jgi:hypothetical protein